MDRKTVPPRLEIRLLDAGSLADTIDCVVEVWSRENTIARALTVTADEYRTAANLACRQAVDERLGLVLWNPANARVVGFLLALDLVDELDVERAKAINGTPNMRVWGQFLSSGLAAYVDAYHGGEQPALTRGQVLYMNIGGVRDHLSGRGYTRLLTTIGFLEFGFGHGYQRMLGIATHPHSIGFVRHPPMRVVAEIDFASFADPRLQAIREPPAIVVGAADLNDSLEVKYAHRIDCWAECIEPHRRWLVRSPEGPLGGETG